VAVRVPYWRVSIEELIAEGDKVAGRWRCEGTHQGPLMGIPATGRRVCWTANDILRIEGQRIAENTVEENMLGLMRNSSARSRSRPQARFREHSPRADSETRNARKQK
jgi:predicted ester cyclase